MTSTTDPAGGFPRPVRAARATVPGRPSLSGSPLEGEGGISTPARTHPRAGVDPEIPAATRTQLALSAAAGQDRETGPVPAGRLSLPGSVCLEPAGPGNPSPAGGALDGARGVPAGSIREPGLMIIPGPRPLLSEVSDEAASFALRREAWDLPVVARFTVDGEPVSKSRARFTKRGSKTQAYTPEKTLQAEQVVGWQFRRAAPGHKLDPEATYGVIALFFCGTRQRRDVDNMLKLILDGLNKVAWPDDEQVTEVSARKTLTLPENARTEIAVYRIGKIQRFTIECEHCGSPFAVFQNRNNAGRARRYCSPGCGHAARRTKARSDGVCEGCGKTLPDLSHGRKFCSRACFSINGRTSVTCTGCGTEFTKQKCHVKAVNYCSGSCRDAANREHRQKLARGTCETCGGPTSKKSYRQCRTCHVQGTGVTGKPKGVAA